MDELNDLGTAPIPIDDRFTPVRPMEPGGPKWTRDQGDLGRARRITRTTFKCERSLYLVSGVVRLQP
jgi:hypothetical protein